MKNALIRIRSWATRSSRHAFCFYFIGYAVISYLGNHLYNYVVRSLGWHFRSTDTLIDTVGIAAVFGFLMAATDSFQSKTKR